MIEKTLFGFMFHSSHRTTVLLGPNKKLVNDLFKMRCNSTRKSDQIYRQRIRKVHLFSFLGAIVIKVVMHCNSKFCKTLCLRNVILSNLYVLLADSDRSNCSRTLAQVDKQMSNEVFKNICISLLL